MRLLHTSTYQLISFFEPNLPPYVILSHVWGDREILFEDIQSSHQRLKQRSGYAKITQTCAQARSDGFDYVWIDTCCIDKRNSTELSEAINSMFRWYQKATVCYAYLGDVESDGDTLGKFTSSRWFTRGWTLQELIAPASLIFFDKHWKDIGTKSSLRYEIANLTRIPEDVLSKMVDHRSPTLSVAQKMSWAAGRKTRRTEDIAYALLGIFDVNMPMIYGEGTKAFIRLQHEIIKIVHDQTIFAWGFDLKSSQSTSVFARSPDDFSSAWELQVAPSLREEHPFLLTGDGRPTEASDYSLTNKGLRIKLWAEIADGLDLLACLHCVTPLTNSAAALTFRKHSSDAHQVVRRGPPRILTRDDLARKYFTLQQLYFQHTLQDDDPEDWGNHAHCRIVFSSIQEFGYTLHGVYSGVRRWTSNWFSGGSSAGYVSIHLRTTEKTPFGERVRQAPFLACLFVHREANIYLVVIAGLIKHSIRLEAVASQLTQFQVTPPNIESVVQNIAEEHRHGLGDVFGRSKDRLERPLGDGSFLKAVVKVKIVEGELMHVVELDILGAAR